MQHTRDPEAGYLDNMFWLPKQQINANAVRGALLIPAGPRGTAPYRDYRETPTHIGVPREYWSPASFPFTTYDMRPRSYQATGIVSRLRMDHQVRNGALVPTGSTLQEDAVAALLRARGGVLQLACGKGKTCIALETIARLRVPSLVVVDTKLLQQQWLDEIATHLHVPGGVGIINGTKFQWNRALVVGTYLTLANHADSMPDEMRRWFGAIFWDECHMVDAPIFSRSAAAFYGRRYGLSATPARPDGMHIVHERHLGPVLYKDLQQEHVPRNVFLQTGVTVDLTNPCVRREVLDKAKSVHLGKLSSYLGRDRERRQVILDVARMRLSQGGKVLVVGRSVEHLSALYADYIGYPSYLHDIPLPTLEEVSPTDSHRTKEVTPALAAKMHKLQKDYITDLVKGRTDEVLLTFLAKPDMQKAQKARIVFAVMKYAKQAYNDKALDTLILIDPVSSVPLLVQIVGRILRYKENKLQPLFIAVEDDIPVCRKLCSTMRAILINTPPEEGGPYRVESRTPGEHI